MLEKAITMNSLGHSIVLAAFAVSTASLDARAEILSATPDHYALRQEAASDLAPDALWERLTDPASWWHPDHTYSGYAANLSLDLRAGGTWSEVWEGGGVVHGEVLMYERGEQLRLSAPFGPLQGMAVDVIWTITIAPGETGGSVVTFDEVANGSAASGLDKIAPAVDQVKTQAIQRLVSTD